MAQYGPNGGVSRVKVTGTDFDLIRARLLSAPDQVTDEVAEGMRLIAADGVRNMRDKVENETGVTKKQTIDDARGRIDSGKMLNKIDQQVTKNKRSVSMRFGWINGRPGYAFFQEYGTKNGIPAMHALTDARLQAEIELTQLLKGL